MHHIGSHTYSCLWYHLVWAVKFRQPLITRELKYPLIDSIREICSKNDYHLEQVNTMPDHIHLLVSLPPSQTISDAVKNIKSLSWKFIKEHNLSPEFRWQSGFGAFYVSPRRIDVVKRYIRNQEKHHRQVNAEREMEKLFQSANQQVEKHRKS